MYYFLISDILNFFLDAFKLFSPDNEGYVIRKNFEEIIYSIKRTLGAIHFDSGTE